jgi:transcriptional regulator with XRE-family HTH domain
VLEDNGHHENLSGYVRRILKEKGLTLSDVERRAGGEISDSYVAGITSGSVKNLTLEKLKALAKGLGVSEYRVIEIASGIPHFGDEDFQESDFASLFTKYKYLSDSDKKEVQVLLNALDNEIERRQTRCVEVGG